MSTVTVTVDELLQDSVDEGRDSKINISAVRGGRGGDTMSSNHLSSISLPFFFLPPSSSSVFVLLLFFCAAIAAHDSFSVNEHKHVQTEQVFLIHVFMP